MSRPIRNDLPPGTSRLGYIIDGDPNTPEMATLLENDGTAIRLTVPWKAQLGEAYRRWFIGKGAHFGDDPDRTKYRYDVPFCLDFHDNFGPVTLVGCKVAGMNEQLISRVGAGRARVDFVVLGGRGGARFERINGFRSELEGLGEWMGLHSLEESIDQDEDGRVTAATLRLNAPRPIQLSSRLNLRAAPTFAIERTGPDATTLRQRMYIESRVGKPRDWDDHLELHNSIRDLVSLSSWNLANYTGHFALRNDNPVRAVAGNVLDERWSKVETYATRISNETAPTRSHDALFTFQHIGPTGVARWIRMRSHFRRGIDPILSSLFHKGTVQTQLAEVGIGFEALAFQLALDAGLSRTKANAENHEGRLVRVGNEVTLPLPFAVADWATRAAAAYNGVKHANRAETEVVDALNAWRESVLVFRLWVAGQLGAAGEDVEGRVTRDRMLDPYKID